MDDNKQKEAPRLITIQVTNESYNTVERDLFKANETDGPTKIRFNGESEENSKEMIERLSYEGMRCIVKGMRVFIAYSPFSSTEQFYRKLEVIETDDKQAKRIRNIKMLGNKTVYQATQNQIDIPDFECWLIKNSSLTIEVLPKTQMVFLLQLGVNDSARLLPDM